MSSPQVEAALRRPQDPDIAQLRRLTPLAAAAAAGHLEVVKMLLEAGAEKDKASNALACMYCLATASYGWLSKLWSLFWVLSIV